jgi:tetratricopeptide (TPR) repeat protein
MNLKKHLDRAAQALERGQADFAVELCDQVMDFAPGERRAAELLTEAAIADGGGRSSMLKKLGSSPMGLAAKFNKLTRNPDAEARSLRRAFIRNPANHAGGIAWGDALERAGYAGAALGVFGGLAKFSADAAKRAGSLAAAQGEVDAALDFYQKALDSNPRDTEAMRARKNLAAEQALRGKSYEESSSSLDSEAFLRAARGEENPGESGE